MNPYIDFVPGSGVGAVASSELEAVTEMFDSAKEEYDVDFEFDAAYLECIRDCNGGTPQKKFFGTDVGDFCIDQFLNYSLDSGQQLNVNVVWSSCEDRLGIYLLPFAALSGGDYLCFDYSRGLPPVIVVWLHEQSEVDKPYTVLVSPSFVDFAGSLRSAADL